MPKFIISGGGTGGHIYPALAIAEALKARIPAAEISFVGALGRMEMEKIPAEGWPIMGLDIIGFPRKPSLKVLSFFFKLWAAYRKARQLLQSERPDAVIGVGGYASGPILIAAKQLGIPFFLQEQNGYAGMANKFVAKSAKRIFVAYAGMERFFPKEKLIISGNPLRNKLKHTVNREEAIGHWGLDPSKPVLLVIGGSLGARTINLAVNAALPLWQTQGIQAIWQTGKFYFPQTEELRNEPISGVVIVPFIDRMDLAYAAADLVVSRAGALSVSELCLAGKASILVPSPNVAEDHQTHNAMALVNQGAAKLVKDDQAIEQLGQAVYTLMGQSKELATLSSKAKAMARPHAAEEIAQQIRTDIGL